MTITASDGGTVKVLEINALEVDVNVSMTVIENGSARSVRAVQIGLMNANQPDPCPERQFYFGKAAVVVPICAANRAGVEYVTESPSEVVRVSAVTVWGVTVLCYVVVHFLPLFVEDSTISLSFY